MPNSNLISRDEFEIEMIRRERRLVPALCKFFEFVLWKGAPTQAHRCAAIEGLLWTVLTPGGAVSTASIGLLALVTAAFSGWAAFETKRSADVAVKATQASVWLQLLSEYADPKMLESMNAMRAYQVAHREHTAESFRSALLLVDLTGQPAVHVLEVDAHRRVISSYFHKVATLVEAEIIDETVIRGAWRSGLLPFIEDVLLPMELAKAESLLAQGKMTAANMEDARQQVEQHRSLWRRLLSIPPR